MSKSWAAALAALLLLAGCGGPDQSTAAPTAGSVVAEPAPVPVDAAEVEPTAEVEQGAAKEAASASTTEPTADDDAEAPAEEESTGTHPELGPLHPVVSVYDGDTIAVTLEGVRERVRIIGIDAPEMARFGNPADCYAQESASQMQSLVQSQEVYLLADPTQADRDRYDRLLRHVVLDDDGHSLAALLMVEGGYAVERQFAAPYRYQPDLVAAQDRASAAGLGLWSACAGADIVPVAPAAPPPAAPTEPAAPATGDCLIKGNIASDGEKIYHVPGQRHYDVTAISPEKGERWFCTEQEARDAGWRRAKI